MTISQFPLPEGGIPTGDTAGRPANPVIGDVYYNGETGILEIFNGTNFVPCSAPAAAPTVAVVDVGTSRAYGSAQGTVTITEGTAGGPADSFIVSTSTGGYTATTTGTTVTITVGNSGSYTFSGQGINNFGTSVAGPDTSVTLTTVPQAPTIGTATTSAGTTNITVAWTLGSNGDKNLSSITITPYLNGTTAQTATTAATTSSTSATIVGLTQNSSYTFKVKATNANGDSLESSASNSITVPILFTVDYLVIAGGGGAGSRIGGGGGAGGYRTSAGTSGGGASAEASFASNLGTNYSVTVGAGGAGAAAGNPGTGVTGSKGSDSIFRTITSEGGGGGGCWQGTNGAAGGSGGGASGDANSTVRTGGAGTANQGYAGGSGAVANNNEYGGGGGGGAGALGGNGAVNGGTGGTGVASDITGTSVTRGGGGGGGVETAGTPGTGGTGGGGNASGPNNTNTGGAGDVNTGGGGGTGGNTGISSGAGGAGGSGVVILRYPDARTITIGAGLTGTESAASGGFKRATITAGSGNVSWS